MSNIDGSHALRVVSPSGELHRWTEDEANLLVSGRLSPTTRVESGSFRSMPALPGSLSGRTGCATRCSRGWPLAGLLHRL